MNPCFRRSSSTQQGVAIIIAISVLAVLTILVMALSYSAGMSQHQMKLETARMNADNLLRAGLDMAAAALSRTPGSLAAKQEMDADFQGDKCHVAAAPADPTHPIYSGNFLKHRPGDVILTVTAEIKKGPGPRKISQTYLLNTDPARPRRVAFDEKLFSQPKAENHKP